jgi:ubiquitin-conjugating enzyme E2 variant
MRRNKIFSTLFQ